jgi:hypothetical protein
MAVLIPLFDSVLGIVVTVAIAIASALISKYVKDKDARDTLTNALNNAAGVALHYGQTQGDQFLQSHSVKNAALNEGMNYIADQAVKAKDHFGLTDADIATKLTAHVAKALSLATPIPPSAAPVVVVNPEVPAEPVVPPVAPPEPPKPVIPPSPVPPVVPPVSKS